MNDAQALVVREDSAALSTVQVQARLAAITEIMAKCMKEGVDYGNGLSRG